jgi:hypothetical protein
MDATDAIDGEGPTRGELRFVDAAGLAQVRTNAAAASMLVAEVANLSGPVRGQLGEFLEAAVEEALGRAGAEPSSVGTSVDAGISLADQLSRAAGVGCHGIVLLIAPLQPLADISGTIDPDDSAALRFWASATTRWPVFLLLDRRNLALAGFGQPQRLDVLLLGRAEGILTPRPSRRIPDERPSGPTAPHTATSIAPTPPSPAPDAPSFEEAPESLDWRQCAEELHAARGPKPLGVVERMFVTRYVPLAEAETAGLVDAAGRQVRAEWANHFARSYSEAFQALRVTGKRPSMVFDVPQLAARIARLHGAKNVELLMVDGMRFDLGLKVHGRLRRMLGGRAACAERLLLWSALPATTATQLELLAHGLEALHRPLDEDNDAVSVARDRRVDVPRRIRIGSRDLMKIDLVEARLREAGPPLPERLDHIADEVAGAVLRHTETLPDRTLLLLFGDHGFLVDSGPHGSGPARQGGASPEEVLVPGFAWLVGGLH